MKKLIPPIAAALLLTALPAHAASGGTTLAFNDTLQTVFDNLSGPTATVLCGIIFVAGLIGIAVSKDHGWMKTAGMLLMVIACIAKAPALMGQLGLSGATATPLDYVLPYLATMAIAAALASSLVVLITRYGQSPRNANDVRFPDPR